MSIQKKIQPIQLGNLHFASNLIQAPLAGLSCAPFRELIAQFGGAAYCVTEMVSAKTLLGRPEKRYIYKSPNEGTLCFQLSGNNATELEEAALRAVSYGADLIDLNCGCPVNKIRKKNSGSKWLSISQELGQVIQGIKSKISPPLSVKIRVDGMSGDRFNTDVVKAINDAGADFIIVHGRHWSERYDTPARLDEIASIVEQSTIPVIGNGDVQDYTSLQKMFEATGCAGIMIGRASVGRPWLFEMLMAEDRGEKYAPPTTEQIVKLLLHHVRQLSYLENKERALLQARKFAKYYLPTDILPDISFLLSQNG
ncbi:MAG: tRNA-dihydrouridine synthase family protein [Gammaproteobacteria bacterium]|jgi:tRNA-dihydrouridine synthase B|nr:tRNA-dihydrouridine synthase family protein [Gammaproteobacteria bacterium]